MFTYSSYVRTYDVINDAQIASYVCTSTHTFLSAQDYVYIILCDCILENRPFMHILRNTDLKY